MARVVVDPEMRMVVERFEHAHGTVRIEHQAARMTSTAFSAERKYYAGFRGRRFARYCSPLLADILSVFLWVLLPAVT
jgi:hypothetical protein